jgi:hypothetical protein
LSIWLLLVAVVEVVEQLMLVAVEVVGLVVFVPEPD